MRRYGKENKPKKELFWYVNKNGFISVYALMILSVVLLFAMYYSQRVYTYALLRKEVDLATRIDVHIVRSIKQNVANTNKVEDGHVEDHKQPQVGEDKTTTWESEYEGIRIQYEQEQTQIKITYTRKQRTFQVFVKLDEAGKEIIAHAYE